jgi:hypothetical protein
LADGGEGDGGEPDGGAWTGFGGTCASLIAPVSWFSDGGAFCPLADGGLEFVNLLLDRNNCGTCGLTCSGVAKCNQGDCMDDIGLPFVCPSPDGGLERTDLMGGDNCGGCGCSCPAGEQCLGLFQGGPSYVTPWGAEVPLAECTIACPPDGPTNSYFPCLLPDGGRECFDVLNDSNNCRACGRHCCPGEACVQGACTGDGGLFPDCGDAG